MPSTSITYTLRRMDVHAPSIRTSHANVCLRTSSSRRCHASQCEESAKPTPLPYSRPPVDVLWFDLPVLCIPVPPRLLSVCPGRASAAGLVHVSATCGGLQILLVPKRPIAALYLTSHADTHKRAPTHLDSRQTSQQRTRTSSSAFCLKLAASFPMPSSGVPGSPTRIP